MPGRDLDEVAIKIEALKEQQNFWKQAVAWVEKHPRSDHSKGRVNYFSPPQEYYPGGSPPKATWQPEAPSSKPSPERKPMTEAQLKREAQKELDAEFGSVKPEPYRCPHTHRSDYGYEKSYVPHVCAAKTASGIVVKVFDPGREKFWKTELPLMMRWPLWFYSQKRLTNPKTIAELRFSIKWAKRYLKHKREQEQLLEATLRSIAYDLQD